jgi:pimeloyl-ACP methyl ester carboxylesterase
MLTDEVVGIGSASSLLGRLGVGVKERAIVIFDEKLPLVGVLTEARPENRTPGRLACILLNSGLVHRVGPNRIYVQLARQLAAAGYPTLRFDLSNRGDSDVRRDGMSFLESSLIETRAAMDLMQRTVGADRFILMGICSGAVNSLQASLEDSRVVGAVAIDGPAYPTFWYHLRHYVKRLPNAQSWLNTVSGRNRWGRLLRGNLTPPSRREDDFASMYGDVTMLTKDQSAKALHRIIDRGVKLMFVYSGSWAYNYHGQFRDAFPDVMKRGAIQVEWVGDADHTFTRLHHQQYLVGMIKQWVVNMYGTSAQEEVPSIRPVRSVNAS